MSKRAKILLSVPFAMMLAGLAFYVSFSWTAENPLRFGVLREMTPEMVSFGFETPEERMIPFELEVVNTQPFSIYLVHADLNLRGEDFLPEDQPSANNFHTSDFHSNTTVRLGSLTGTRSGGVVISESIDLPSTRLPGSSASRVRVLVDDDIAYRVNWEKVTVGYRWAGWARYKMYDLWHRLGHQAPTWFGTERSLTGKEGWLYHETSVEVLLPKS